MADSKEMLGVQVNNSALTDFYGQKQGAEGAILEVLGLC